MIRVKNRKIILKLARRNFGASKVRNVLAVLAIALTTLLFTSLFTLGTGMLKSTQRADMIMSGGDGHVKIQHMTESEYHTISSHPLIQEMSYTRKLAESVDNTPLIKRQTDFWYYDDLQLKYSFIELTGGHKPQKEKEIIVDTKTLELLGVPQKLGTPLTLELTIHNENVMREFVLAGWWESHPGVSAGTIISSRAYVDAYLEEWENTYYQDQSKTGSIIGNIKFTNSQSIEENLETVLSDSGFSTDINAQNYLNTGINPLYLSKNTSMGLGRIIPLSSALVLFMLVGYLIIYNIFQISVVRDIRFYGLLKTIGTTGRQLRAIIGRQAWMLSLVGIPLGLFGGLFVGNSLLPTLIKQSQFAGSKAVVSTSPLIFVAAIMFTLITVFISIRKPLEIAAKISPVEAVSYTDANPGGRQKKKKKSSNGGTPRRMAWANLGRNKRRTVLVILSLSLSIVLTITIFNLSQNVDVDKALQNTSDSDFRIGHVIANETNTHDWVESGFFLQGEVYQKLTGKTYAMSYAFDVVEDKEADMESFLKWYTNSVEPSMNYQSKSTVIAGLKDIQDTILLIGGTLALIIGIIGVLNFINIILTSILTRRREFAVLRSIGMTRRQLVKMLCFEGCYYATWTAAVSIPLSIGSLLLIVRPLSAQIWF